MSLSFVKPSAPEGAQSKSLTTIDLGPPPSVTERQAAIASILAGPQSMTLFKHYWWLAGKPLPVRRNGETNESYLKVHWRHLVRAARAYDLTRDDSDHGPQSLNLPTDA